MLAQLVRDARQQFVEGLLTGRQQDVGVAALRHAAARLGPVGQPVALDHRDPVGMVREHMGREQPGQARPDDDGVPPPPRDVPVPFTVSNNVLPLVRRDPWPTSMTRRDAADLPESYDLARSDRSLGSGRAPWNAPATRLPRTPYTRTGPPPGGRPGHGRGTVRR